MDWVKKANQERTAHASEFLPTHKFIYATLLINGLVCLVKTDKMVHFVPSFLKQMRRFVLPLRSDTVSQKLYLSFAH